MILLLEYSDYYTDEFKFVREVSRDKRLHLKDAKDLAAKKAKMSSGRYKIKVIGELSPVEISKFSKQHSSNLLVQYVDPQGSLGVMKECTVEDGLYLPEAQRAVNAQHDLLSGSMSILGEVIPILSYQKQRVVDAYKKLQS